MKKEQADKIIMEYLQKIYGFAVKKAYSYDEAEDICSEIVLEVYQSLLRSDEIANIEGYIWRISEHTYSKFVSSKKKHEGISIDGLEIPYFEEEYCEDPEAETKRLRREIAFLTEIRRKIVYMFYFLRRSISAISSELNIPEGTVKWHLNRARHDLKEGFSMERTIGKLGLYPFEALDIAHDGSIGDKGGPEYYLNDKINLNIVYSVYHTPRTKEEIAAELGMTLVYIEDKIKLLEDNGFIFKTKNDKYTTLVRFQPETFSQEFEERAIKVQLRVAEDLVREYVPSVLEAIKDVEDIYIPSGNRELFEAAVVFYAVANKCKIKTDIDHKKYYVQTRDGGYYIPYVRTDCKPSDPDFVPTLKDIPSYWSGGNMQRWSDKYPSVYSWSVDTRYSTREGFWQNNLMSDYEYLYEFIRGELPDTAANIEKIARLKERGYLTSDNKPAIMIAKGGHKDFFKRVPALDESLKERFADTALELAMIEARDYPPQIQDLIVYYRVKQFIGNMTAIMVMDILYSNGTFKPLTEDEKITSQLIMFSDILPI